MVALKSDGWSCNNAITQSVKLGSDSVPEGSRGERERKGGTDRRAHDPLYYMRRVSEGAKLNHHFPFAPGHNYTVQ